MKPLIIQAHINENARPETNPNVPVTPEACAAEGLAAARAGAAVVHFHARNAAGGQAPFDAEFYLAAGRALRAASDVLWWPPQGFAATPQRRWEHVEALVADPSAGLELISIDPGGGNMLIYDPRHRTFATGDITQELRDADAGADEEPVPDAAHWIWFCERARELKLRPLFGVLEPGFLRRVLSFHDAGLVDPPLLLHFFLTERFGFGLPPTVESIGILQSMIPDSIPSEWFLSTMGCSERTERELVDHAIRTGGHLRVGLGCPPLEGWPAGRSPTNAEVVAEIVARADAAGRPVATPDDARTLLGIEQVERVGNNASTRRETG